MVGAVSLLIISRHSDRVHERRYPRPPEPHAAWRILHSVCGCHHISLALAGVRVHRPQRSGRLWDRWAPFWAIPTETLPSRIVGSVMGFVNCDREPRGLLCPSHRRVSKQEDRTFFSSGFAYLGAITVVGAGLATFLKNDACIPGNGTKGSRSLTRVTRRYAISTRFPPARLAVWSSRLTELRCAKVSEKSGQALPEN